MLNNVPPSVAKATETVVGDIDAVLEDLHAYAMRHGRTAWDAIVADKWRAGMCSLSLAIARLEQEQEEEGNGRQSH